MVSTANLIYLAINIFSLLILFQSTNQASSSDYSNLLSRLYKKASDSNRPLILIFDKETLRPNPKHSNLLDVIGKEIELVNHKAPSLNRLKFKKKRTPKIFPHQSHELDNSLEKQFLALLPVPKRVTKKPKSPRSPVIKSLLRISNNLRCEAKNECQDECSEKYSYSEIKEDNCNIKCEEKFECKEEKQTNSCEDNECQDSYDECGGGGCTGSTKGSLLEVEKNWCPEC